MYLERCSLPEKKDEIGVHVLAILFFSPSTKWTDGQHEHLNIY
jgi:hypothetical protein